jgi:hypothetical protein
VRSGVAAVARRVVELQLRIEGTAARQYLGAHKACLEEHTRPTVHLELESEDN